MTGVTHVVLVAWTERVVGVGWELGEWGVRIVEPGRLPAKMYMW